VAPIIVFSLPAIENIDAPAHGGGGRIPCLASTFQHFS
jgi:hypothetical protein